MLQSNFEPTGFGLRVFDSCFGTNVLLLGSSAWLFVHALGHTSAGAAAGERVVLFGGCLDLSSFLSLSRNYVQSKELWLLDMGRLRWAWGAGACNAAMLGSWPWHVCM